jgi:hypothetical protein
MLAEDREAARRARRDHDLESLKPSDPAEALDAHHFAERFGLFLIILLAAWGVMCAILGTRASPVPDDAYSPGAVRGSAPPR